MLKIYILLTACVGVIFCKGITMDCIQKCIASGGNIVGNGQPFALKFNITGEVFIYAEIRINGNLIARVYREGDVAFNSSVHNFIVGNVTNSSNSWVFTLNSTEKMTSNKMDIEILVDFQEERKLKKEYNYLIHHVSKEQSKVKWWWYFVIVVIFILLIGIGGFAWRRNNYRRRHCRADGNNIDGIEMAQQPNEGCNLLP